MGLLSRLTLTGPWFPSDAALLWYWCSLWSTTPPPLLLPPLQLLLVLLLFSAVCGERSVVLKHKEICQRTCDITDEWGEKKVVRVLNAKWQNTWQTLFCPKSFMKFDINRCYKERVSLSLTRAFRFAFSGDIIICHRTEYLDKGSCCPFGWCGINYKFKYIIMTMNRRWICWHGIFLLCVQIQKLKAATFKMSTAWHVFQVTKRIKFNFRRCWQNAR